MWLTQNLGLWQTTFIKAQNAILIAAMRYRFISGQNFKTGRAAVNKETGDFLFDTTRGFFLTAGNKHNDEIGNISMADKMFGAVNDPIITILTGGTLHAAHI